LEESYPERIRMTLVSLKLEVQKSLCRGGEWNGRTTMAKLVGIPPCFFAYLQEELRLHVDGPLQEDVIKTSRCRKAILDNLSARNVRTKLETGIIRVDEESHLDAVRKVFGQSFGVGICAPVPSMKMLRCNPSLKATVWLRNMDPVRIVSCLPEECDLEPDREKPIADETHSIDVSATAKSRKGIKLLCSFRGMDIRYSMASNDVPELSVQSRFVKVRGDSHAIRKIHGNIICDSDSESGSSTVNVEIGDYITVEGKKVYVISDITENGTVRCVSPTFPVNDPIEISLEQANLYLMQSIK
jgi:hypothetical protein